jgi:hypothetical protein
VSTCRFDGLFKSRDTKSAIYDPNPCSLQLTKAWQKFEGGHDARWEKIEWLQLKAGGQLSKELIHV